MRKLANNVSAEVRVIECYIALSHVTWGNYFGVWSPEKDPNGTPSKRFSFDFALCIDQLQFFAHSDVETACSPNAELQPYRSMWGAWFCHCFRSLQPVYLSLNRKRAGLPCAIAVAGVLNFFGACLRGPLLIQKIRLLNIGGAEKSGRVSGTERRK